MERKLFLLRLVQIVLKTLKYEDSGGGKRNYFIIIFNIISICIVQIVLYIFIYMHTNTHTHAHIYINIYLGVFAELKFFEIFEHVLGFVSYIIKY